MANVSSGTGKGGKSFQDRELAARVRTLALTEIETILSQPEMDELKKAVLLKLASTLLPRLNEHTGEGGEDLKIIISSETSERYGLDPDTSDSS